MVDDEFEESLHAKPAFSGRESIAAEARLVCLGLPNDRVFVIKHLRLLAALALCLGAAASGSAAEPQSAADAQAKLEALRGRITELTSRLGQELKERDALSTRLREADLGITAQRRRLEALDSEQQVAERQRTLLHAEQARVRDSLDGQRAELAAEVRAQYMMGRSDELRLLLSQANPADAGRMLAYYGYFTRARAARIEEIGAAEARLQQLVAASDEAAAKLKALKQQAVRQVAELSHARRERAQAVAALNARVEGGHQELARLEREKQALESLVADLARVLEDFPVDSREHFDQLRGKLPWPVPGKMTVRYQETRTNGAPTALRSNGVLIESVRGAKVRAPFYGRVVYADWLQGMGMLLIIAHGGGYLTLYGHAEVLYKSVGDSVAPGDVIAALGDAGAAPQLYFEIREGRRPVDPKAWLRTVP
jgi:murein hydrolase activator